ncbi:MAG: NAD-binding protein [Magnetococcales bacterium]|nr:NAD-binding protein [Magnetococcales bacterium]
MNRVTFLILRRMRKPLLILLACYAISILGLTLAPGVDEAGNSAQMSFFHAFYFVSYTATTIGFGEIPQSFTDAQRMWVLITIYLTVISWFYAIGSIINLMQDQSFRRAITLYAFRRKVKSLGEPFYLLCGFGDTGKNLTRSLTNQGHRVVIMDINEKDISFIALNNFLMDVPGLAGDARYPYNMVNAGLKESMCRGVLALTHDESVNLKVALTTRLLRPDLETICRAETPAFIQNMVTCGVPHILNPFTAFADHLAMALEAPAYLLLHYWLSGVTVDHLPEPLFPPRGQWLLCGFGRFGHALQKSLEEHKIETSPLDLHPVVAEGEHLEALRPAVDAEMLIQAGIMEAKGLVAGTEDDTLNLTIVLIARQLNPELFVVVRQNRRTNREMFTAIGPDLALDPSELLAREAYVVLTLPRLPEFLQLARKRSPEWINDVTSRLIGAVGEESATVWTIRIGPEESPALMEALEEGYVITLKQVSRRLQDRSRSLSCMALMLVRDDETRLLPEMDLVLEPGDELLLCGDQQAQLAIEWILADRQALSYASRGVRTRDGWLWRRLARHKKQQTEEAAALRTREQ